jgi:hypothetical protein
VLPRAATSTNAPVVFGESLSRRAAPQARANPARETTHATPAAFKRSKERTAFATLEKMSAGSAT